MLHTAPACRRIWIFVDKDSHLKKGDAGTGRLAPPRYSPRTEGRGFPLIRMSGAGVDDGGWQAAQAMSSGAVRRVMETSVTVPSR